ncbi:hypothetical protein evm_014008, partial [Chilo suppressalis]
VVCRKAFPQLTRGLAAGVDRGRDHEAVARRDDPLISANTKVESRPAALEEEQELEAVFAEHTAADRAFVHPLRGCGGGAPTSDGVQPPLAPGAAGRHPQHVGEAPTHDLFPRSRRHGSRSSIG